jgi:hypothetical protein
MLRMTSNRIKESVDKVRPPVIVRWNQSFLNDKVNDTTPEKIQFVISQLTSLTALCRITTINLLYDNYPHLFKIEGHDAESLAGVLEQSPVLAHLNLNCPGTVSRAGSQSHLNLRYNSTPLYSEEIESQRQSDLSELTTQSVSDLNRGEVGYCSVPIMAEWS